MKLEIKIAAQDKEKMVEAYRSSRSAVDLFASQSGHTDVDGERLSQPIPPPQHTDYTEGWTVIDKGLSYV